MNSPTPNPAEQLLVGVGLPRDFVMNLVAADDWSMIIKLHAVFEAVVGSAIVKKLQTPKVEEVVAQLDFNNIKSGKVAFARALGLLSKPEVAFLRGLSELRNSLVHDIKNVGFSVKAHAAALAEPERKKFKSEFGYYVCGLPGGQESFNDLFARNPRQILLMAAYGCLLMIAHNDRTSTKNMLAEALLSHRAKT